MSVAAQMSFVHPRSEPTSEDLIDASLRFEGGRIGTLNASRLSQRKVRSVTVTELERLIELPPVDYTAYPNSEKTWAFIRKVGAPFGRLLRRLGVGT